MSGKNVDSFKYFYKTKTLVVKYSGGTVYSYSPVSNEEFLACSKTDNASQVVHSIVRKGNLVGKKVEIND